ncbi:MAG TPA: tetratricopeptide repeat protein [Xanthobacteraceae bacterium]|nr:tetratricopeptide repeat protein [Xanthobacteraceae bacterium]
MRRFLLFPILCSVLNFASLAYSQTPPPFYGVYALHDGQLTELKESSVNENILNGSKTIAPPSNVRFPDGRVQFILYRRELTQSAPDIVFVHIVARIAREIQQGSILGQGYDRPGNGAWYVRDRGYKFRVAPFGSNREMVLVRSADPNFALPDGRYAINFGDKVYDFLINRESSSPEHCVNQVSQPFQPPQFLQCEPTPAQSLLEKAKVAFRAKEYDRAIADLTEAIRLEPTASIYFLWRADVYSNKGDKDRAIADYSEAIRLEPKLTAALIRRGLAYLNKGDSDRAITDFNEAIRLAPNDFMTFRRRAAAYHEKKDYDRAIADYSEAIRLNQNSAMTYLLRGHMYRDKKDYDRAITDYNQAIRLYPNSTDAPETLSHIFALEALHEIYLLTKQYDRAIANYSEIIQLNPLNPIAAALAYSLRGRAYAHKYDYERAIADFNVAIQINPKDLDCYYYRCLFRAGAGRELQQALDDCNNTFQNDRFVKLARQGAVADPRGFIYLKLGDIDKAINAFDAALKPNPKLAYALYGRGISKIRKGDKAGGGADIAAAEAIQPNIAEEWVRIGIGASSTAMDLAEIIRKIVVSHYGDDPILGNYVLWEAVGSALENTFKIVIGAGLTEAQKQAALSDFKDMMVTALTKKNFPKIAGPFTAAMLVDWVADAFAPVIADTSVEAVRKKYPAWTNAHPTVVEFMRAGITVSIVDAAAFGVGTAQTRTPVGGAYSVLVAETFLLVQSSIELAKTELNKAPSEALQQYAAQTEVITNVLRNQLALCNANKDTCSKQLIASALRAQGMLDDAIANDSIIIASKKISAK